MSKPFHQLIDPMSTERKRRIHTKTEVLKNDMALRELREALALTQEELANTLNMKQAAISKFENQSDIYLSTLRKILFAMGAELKIVAKFPEGEVQINQFDEIRNTLPTTKKAIA
jgi:transcriptional regulator with XRE-family HTH domain